MLELCGILNCMKKIIIGAAIVGVIILLIIISIFISGKSANAPGTLIPTPTEGAAGSALPRAKTIEVVRQATPHYSVGVPTGFTANLTSNTGGGQTLSMAPTDTAFLEKNASISIQEIDASVSSLAKQQGVFQALGHSSGQISLGNVTATKYTSKIPTGNGQNLFETVLLFQKGNTVYQVRLGYQSAEKDQALENTFDTVVANLQLN